MPYRLACLALALSAAAAAHAQTTFYSCVDAKGNRLTSDRPIMECLDREQQQYSPQGSRKGKLGPSLTANERAALEEKQRKEAEQQARLAEEKQRDRSLVGRYPDEAAHQRERAASLARIDEAIATGVQKDADLQKQRKQLDVDARAAADDVVKSGRIRRAMAENDENQAAIRRLLAAQQEERERIVRRFDEELVRLKVLWAQMPPKAASAASEPKS